MEQGLNTTGFIWYYSILLLLLSFSNNKQDSYTHLYIFRPCAQYNTNNFTPPTVLMWTPRGRRPPLTDLWSRLLYLYDKLIRYFLCVLSPLILFHLVYQQQITMAQITKGKNRTQVQDSLCNETHRSWIHTNCTPGLDRGITLGNCLLEGLRGLWRIRPGNQNRSFFLQEDIS